MEKPSMLCELHLQLTLNISFRAHLMQTTLCMSENDECKVNNAAFDNDSVVESHAKHATDKQHWLITKSRCQSQTCQERYEVSKKRYAMH